MRTGIPDVIAALDRHFEFLFAQEGANFVVHLSRFLNFVDGDARIADYTHDIELDARTLMDEFHAYDTTMCAELKVLRERIRTDRFAATSPQARSGFSLASFDKRVAAPERPPTILPYDDRIDHTNAGKLLELQRVQCGGSDPGTGASEDTQLDLAQIDLDRVRAERAHLVQFRAFNIRLRQSAGYALRRLRFIARQVNPHGLEGVPLDDADDDKCDELWKETYRIKPDLVRRGVWGHIDGQDAAFFRDFVDRAKHDLQVVFEDLRLRLGGTLSRLALLERFKQRCEWYDTERMRKLAEEAATSNQKERRLTDELARFLFDAGLAPMTEANTGGLRPDIVNASGGLYVECKQYGANGATPSNVRQWTRQVWSTLHRLRGTPFDVREVFLVVFRREGARLALPPRVEAEGVTMFPILVDVAPPSLAGSKEKTDATPITDADLRPNDDPAGSAGEPALPSGSTHPS